MHHTHLVVGYWIFSTTEKISIITYAVVMACLSVFNISLLHFTNEADSLITLDGPITGNQKWEIKDILNVKEDTETNETIHNEFQSNWYKIQDDYYCCGIDSYIDIFDEEKRYNGRCLPKSCCRNKLDCTTKVSSLQ